MRLLILIQEILEIVVVPAALASLHRDLLRLVLLLAHGLEDLLELLLVDLLPQLAGAGQLDEPALDIVGARGFYEANPPQPIGGIGLEDLGEDRLPNLCVALPAKDRQSVLGIDLGGTWTRFCSSSCCPPWPSPCCDWSCCNRARRMASKSSSAIAQSC